MPGKRRAKGDGALFKRSDGLWVASLEIPSADGKRRQKRVYAKSYSAAREKLRVLRSQVDAGLLTSTGKTPLAVWLNKWLTEIKGPHVRPNTYTYYEEAIRIHISPVIGARRLNQLTPEDVRGMLRSVSTSANSQRAHKTLKMALQAAVVEGVLARNVCEAVTMPKHLKQTRDAFTVPEAQTVIRAAIATEASRYETGDGPALATLWAAAFLSGARPAELLGLEWNRVDLELGLADFSWQLQQLKKTHGCGEPVDGKYPCARARPSYCPQAHWNFEDGFEYRDCYKSLLWTRPKTKTGVRVVPLIPGLVEMLKQHAQIVEPNPFGLVWHHRDGRPISPTDSHKLWRELTAGITELPWYSARHSTATMLQAHGVPEEVRMKIMGQSSLAAHRGYVHVDQTQTRAALAHLSGLLDETAGRVDG